LRYFQGIPLVGYLPVNKIKKFLQIVFPMSKNPLTPNFSQVIESTWGEDQEGQKLEFSKSSTNWLKFDVMEFFDMGNTNLKKLFDFDHKKVPYKGYTPRVPLKLCIL
jgi:hypothetical protein